MTSKEYISQCKEVKSEHQEQVEVNKYCTRNNILMFAIPNGGHRHKKTASDLKAEGVKAGVPDMFIAVPNKYYAGLFIELKRRAKSLKSGKKSFAGISISDSQDEWIDKLNNQGYRAIVCYGADEAIETIDEYMEIIK